MTKPVDFDPLLRAYASYRTGYSESLVARVLSAAPARPRLLDLASGTGLSLPGFAERARRVVACDLAPGMLRANPARARVLARAEALPFLDAAFDLVTCAQAFHWMEPRAAFGEMRRVLAPEGVAAVWWKYEDLATPFARAVESAYRDAVGKPMAHTPLARGDPLPPTEPFARVEEARLPFAVRYDADAYVGYHASREILRRDAGGKRDAALAAIRRAVEAMHGRAPFEVRYVERLVLLEG